MRIAKVLRSQTDKIGFTRRTAGAAPGTLVYTGRQEMEEVHVHLTHYDSDVFNFVTSVDSIPEDNAPGKVTWFDVRGLHRVELIEKLGTAYGMHPLSLEDVLDVNQRPQMEGYKDGILLQLKAFAFEKETRELSIEQVSIYLTDETVITFQEDAGDLFEPVRKRLEMGNGRIRSKGPDYLTYALVDNIVDKYFTVLDQIEETLDELEDIIIKDPQIETKSKIHDLRLALLTMRKSTSPTRELAGRLGDTEHRLVSEDTQFYVRDLKDHIIQITDLVETYRDVTNGLYDLYVSEISFRMNSVMQTLTVVSTIFIPLGFLAGIFGMNFVYIPGLDNPYGYYILWGVMGLITGAALMWFRSKKWI
ncbi:magnesium/cobalt transporter CorA [Neolewinella aurantiaca]|uniref:Magnesium transport protein CorA n=1 Tax=Neolewinella aurantiaca TaxID=2602767 RepID=A0A5C7FUY9_9BACT|nr:magnesium/cobalt transporter CorA [Neolewinella aurantiaca]TXF88677.1 magnesium/cobalt transporter CorA [Neolewinella aurantiaca]